MFLIFQAVFSWAIPIQGAVSAGVAMVSRHVGNLLTSMPLLHRLVSDGIFARLGTVVEFLPQILFLFILILEESGYLPRAAFLLDRMMLAAGLTGRSFISLLSSFASSRRGACCRQAAGARRRGSRTYSIAPIRRVGCAASRGACSRKTRQEVVAPAVAPHAAAAPRLAQSRLARAATDTRSTPGRVADEPQPQQLSWLFAIIGTYANLHAASRQHAASGEFAA